MAFSAQNTVESVVVGTWKDQNLSQGAQKSADNVSKSMKGLAKSIKEPFEGIDKLRKALFAVGGGVGLFMVVNAFRSITEHARNNNTEATKLAKSLDSVSNRIMDSVANSRIFNEVLGFVLFVAEGIASVFETLPDRIGTATRAQAELIRTADEFLAKHKPEVGAEEIAKNIQAQIDTLTASPVISFTDSTSLLNEFKSTALSTASAVNEATGNASSNIIRGNESLIIELENRLKKILALTKEAGEEIGFMNVPNVGRDLPRNVTGGQLMPFPSQQMIPETDMPEITWDEAFEQAEGFTEKMEVLANAIREDIPSAFELAKQSVISFVEAGSMGISTFFSTLFEGLVQGELSFKKAAKAMLATILSAIGTEAIARGSVMMLSAFASFPAINGVMLAKGAALVSLGGALKGTAAGLASSGGGGGSNSEGREFGQRNPVGNQRNQSGLSVSINFEGDVIGLGDAKDFALTLGKEINKQISLDRLS